MATCFSHQSDGQSEDQAELLTQSYTGKGKERVDDIFTQPRAEPDSQESFKQPDDSIELDDLKHKLEKWPRSSQILSKSTMEKCSERFSGSLTNVDEEVTNIDKKEDSI